MIAIISRVTRITALLACAMTVGAYTPAAKADPVVHEPFDYELGGINTANGGTGFAAAWRQTRSNPVAADSGLDWGASVSTGRHAQGVGWSAMLRNLGATSSLDTAGLMDDGATLWFSAILGLEDQDPATADINIALGTDQFGTGFGTIPFSNRENLFGLGSQGIGITHSDGFIQGVYWQDTGNDGIGERNESSNTSVRLSAGGNSDFALIVGKIDWGADSSADETLTLYAPDTSLNIGSPILAPWSIPALNQSAFDTLAIQFNDNSQVDEIRFGASYEDVAAFPDDPFILRVNTVTGRATLFGDDNVDYDINYLQLTSPGGSLNPAGWYSLSDQDFDGNGPSDDSGNGWEEGGVPNPNILVESYLLGNSTIAAGTEIELGRVYDNTVDAADIQLRYRNSNGTTLDGLVTYFAELTGDYNGDGTVDAADYTVWRDSLGQTGTGLAADGNGDEVVDSDDYDAWRSNFGFSLPSAAFDSSSGVPEPPTMALCAMVCSAILVARFKYARLAR